MCEAHWTDDDGDSSFTDSNSRVITVACVGASGVYTCSEHDFASSWDCTGTGLSGQGLVCVAYTWYDDDPDPYFDSGATWTSGSTCVG